MQKKLKSYQINRVFLKTVFFSLFLFGCEERRLSQECKIKYIGIYKDNLSFLTNQKELSMIGYRNDEMCSCYFKSLLIEDHGTSLFVYINKKNIIDSVICSITFNDTIGITKNSQIIQLKQIVSKYFYTQCCSIDYDTIGNTNVNVKWRNGHI